MLLAWKDHGEKCLRPSATHKKKGVCFMVLFGEIEGDRKGGADNDM